MLFQNFDIKDIGKSNFILSVEVHIDKSRKLLPLSQRVYTLIVFWSILGWKIVNKTRFQLLYWNIIEKKRYKYYNLKSINLRYYIYTIIGLFYWVTWCVRLQLLYGLTHHDCKHSNLFNLFTHWIFLLYYLSIWNVWN